MADLTSHVTLRELISFTPEHPVPYAGDVVHLVYDPARGPVGATVATEADGWAVMTVAAPAEEAAYSMEAARKALVRSVGGDPDDPAALAMARERYGAMAFADHVNLLAKQRLFALGCVRTGVLPFLAPEFMRGEGPRPNQDYTFQVRFRLRPHAALTSYEPVEAELPAAPGVTDEAVDERLMGMMGGAVRWQDIPEEARGGFERLRAQVREQLEAEGSGAARAALVDACTDALADRLVAEPPQRYADLLRDQMANQFAANIEAGGTAWDAYIAAPDFDMDAFKAEMTEAARTSLRRGLALDALADHLAIALTEDDVLAAVGSVARGYEHGAAQAMIDNGQLPQLCEVARRAKAGDWLARTARTAGAGAVSAADDAQGAGAGQDAQAGA